VAKKPVISVDNLEDTGDGTVLSPATDLAASMFAIWNVANALVMESASIWGTFVQFHEQIATSLDKMMEVLVKEQAVAQRDQFTAFRLLEQITEALERLLPRQAEVVPTEGAEGTEVVLVVVADVEWAQTPLFLRDSDLTDMLFVLEASKDGREDSESSSGSEASGSSDTFRAVDRDAMI
jgi:hypothetical protein